MTFMQSCFLFTLLTGRSRGIVARHTRESLTLRKWNSTEFWEKSQRINRSGGDVSGNRNLRWQTLGPGPSDSPHATLPKLGWQVLMFGWPWTPGEPPLVHQLWNLLHQLSVWKLWDGESSYQKLMRLVRCGKCRGWCKINATARAILSVSFSKHFK